MKLLAAVVGAFLAGMALTALLCAAVLNETYEPVEECPEVETPAPTPPAPPAPAPVPDPAPPAPRPEPRWPPSDRVKPMGFTPLRCERMDDRWSHCVWVDPDFDRFRLQEGR